MNRREGLPGLFALALALSLFAPDAAPAEPPYDPLAVPEESPPDKTDLTVRDMERMREIPIRVYLPPGRSPSPIVLFSPGLGGSRQGSAYLGNHWARRGYIVVSIQHPGSDTSVWQNKPPGQRMDAMKRAASIENFLLRAKDVHVVLDQLERWSSDPSSTLVGRLNLERVGMSGHSFGALTTQAVSGQHFFLGDRILREPRIKAAVVFSPSSPRYGDPGVAFGHVQRPWMLITGTRDLAPIGTADLASRLAVFPALPTGSKYELVLYRAEHSAFTDGRLPGDTERRNPNHHRAILALSTAFWDAYLRGDAAARRWLDGDGPRAVLEERDRWQAK